jgi:hypothetical protein
LKQDDEASGASTPGSGSGSGSGSASNPASRQGGGHEPESLEDVVGGIEDIGERGGKVCLSDALDTFGSRSFSPLLIVLPLIELSPFGGIPGIPTVLAILIALIALQMLIGRDHVWLPGFVADHGIDGEKLAKATHKLDRAAEWIDNHLGERLDWMLEGAGQKAAALVIILLCFSVPPLEFLPFASSVPMLAVAAIGLALLVRDGLLMAVAMLAGSGSMIFAISTMLSGSGSG